MALLSSVQIIFNLKLFGVNSRLRFFLVGFLEKLASSTIFGEGGAYIVERGSAKNSLKIFAHRKYSNQNIF